MLLINISMELNLVTMLYVKEERCEYELREKWVSQITKRKHKEAQQFIYRSTVSQRTYISVEESLRIKSISTLSSLKWLPRSNLSYLSLSSGEIVSTRLSVAYRLLPALQSKGGLNFKKLRSQHTPHFNSTRVLNHFSHKRMVITKLTTQFEALGELGSVGGVALAFMLCFSALGYCINWLESYL